MVLHVSLYYDDLHSFGKWSFQSWSKALLWGAIFDQAGCLSTLLPCAMERTQRPKVESTMPGSSWLPCGCLAVIGIGWEQGRQFQVLLIWHGVSAGTDISWVQLNVLEAENQTSQVMVRMGAPHSPRPFEVFHRQGCVFHVLFLYLLPNAKLHLNSFLAYKQ